MKINELSNFNISVLLKIASMLGFAIFFIITIINGSVSLYINPKNLPFLIFAIIAMVVVSFFLAGDLFVKENKKTGSLGMLFFILPVIMAFLIPAQSLDSSSRSVDTSGISGGAVLSNGGQQNVLEYSTFEDGDIILDDKNFSIWLDLIYRNPQKYTGREIELVGFIYKDDNYFDKNQFAAARMMMVCCAADMQMTGFICSYDQKLEYDNDTWVRVRGKIEKTELEGETIPIIKVQSMEETQRPKEDYIYPNY
jgi:putative membrane protein